jgi:hypothetical protein
VTAATRSPRPSLPVPVLAAAVLLVLRGRALPSSPSSSSGRRPGSRSIWFCIDLTQPSVLLAGLRLHALSVLLAGSTSIVQARPRPRPAREDRPRPRPLTASCSGDWNQPPRIGRLVAPWNQESAASATSIWRPSPSGLVRPWPPHPPHACHAHRRVSSAPLAQSVVLCALTRDRSSAKKREKNKERERCLPYRAMLRFLAAW